MKFENKVMFKLADSSLYPAVKKMLWLKDNELIAWRAKCEQRGLVFNRDSVEEDLQIIEDLICTDECDQLDMYMMLIKIVATNAEVQPRATCEGVIGYDLHSSAYPNVSAIIGVMMR